MEKARARALGLLALLLGFAGAAHGQLASRHMVAAAHPLAAEAGRDLLRKGGSALDAAIAAQLVLNVVEPQASGIGGGAFLLAWSAEEGRLYSYDGRETAPAAAKPERFLDAKGEPLAQQDAVASGLSVGVPGLLRVLELAHSRHGKLPWAALFEPAIAVAESGFPMRPRMHEALKAETLLPRTPLYYQADGQPHPVGALIRNPELAQTFRAIAAGGAAAFYEGPIAADIVAAVRGHARPGDLTAADLADYRALERDPVCAVYRQRRVCSMGPPSSGGVALLQILGFLERSGFGAARPLSAPALHYYSEAARLAYADRDRYLGDPDFVRVPVEGLLETFYLNARAQLIGERSGGRFAPGEPRLAPPFADVPQPAETGTSHLSVVAASGDAVSLTTTIEATFGSRIAVRGFLLNNQLTDFAFRPQADGRAAANRVEGGKRPRSSMAPTIVIGDDNRVDRVLGSPGGGMIINYVAKALVAMLDWGMDAQAATSLPNFGSLNGPTLIERGTPLERLAKDLQARGHEVRAQPLTSGLHIIERTPAGWRGGADPRRDGVAAGD